MKYFLQRNFTIIRQDFSFKIPFLLTKFLKVTKMICKHMPKNSELKILNRRFERTCSFHIWSGSNAACGLLFVCDLRINKPKTNTKTISKPYILMVFSFLQKKCHLLTRCINKIADQPRYNVIFYL